MTKAELERLAILAEECGEVVQIVNKIIRHGYESYNPNDPEMIPNRELLEKELGDVEFICRLMLKEGDVDRSMIGGFEKQKMMRIGKYLHHNSTVGMANES